ncbi:hypothetical protein [Bdellovibrio bacteriovorus]|uniref:hypothetical protein n=1 Tax=Bdellovibrio bacteriovorus TaxID=959 RepID=UPI0035A73BBA
MSNPGVIQYIATKLEEQASNAWSFRHLKFQGLISIPQKIARTYGFNDIHVIIHENGSIDIDGVIYKNTISKSGYASAQEAVIQIYEHLIYIDQNYLRLCEDPENYVEQGFMNRLRRIFG